MPESITELIERLYNKSLDFWTMQDKEDILSAARRGVEMEKALRAAQRAMGAHGPCKNNSCAECGRTWKLIAAALPYPSPSEKAPRTAASNPKWRPIESAPRDGEMILLGDGKTVTAGFFKPEFDSVYPWIHLDSGTDNFLNGWQDRKHSPTHWMPLPSPPPSEKKP